MFLYQSEAKSKEMGAMYTEREIAQQPDLWLQTYQNMVSERERIQTFLGTILDRHTHVKVILAGAGTSAFVGDTIQPYLQKVSGSSKLEFHSIPTTSIVSNPNEYLHADTPTIMVSFARSGNSPESVASVELGEKLVQDFYQVQITCNPDGYLAKKSVDQEKSLLLLMPEESNDQGFAMTSSFTCMMLSAMLLFQTDRLEQYESVIQHISQIGSHFLKNGTKRLATLAEKPFSNIVYLGSGSLLGLAHEASLKMLELVNGDIFTSYDSPLGFRHGPKTILNDKSLVVLMISNNPHTRKYDLDLLKEIYREKEICAAQVLAISDEYLEEVRENSDYYLYTELPEGSIDWLQGKEDAWLGFPFILYGQVFALYQSLQLGFQPDNPCPSGSVNRVVQGVTIHPYSS